MRAGNNEAAHKVWDAASQTLKETEVKEAHTKTVNLYEEVKKQRESQPQAEPTVRPKNLVRNVDPFERKRRLAQLGQADQARSAEEAQQLFSSRKILSTKESRD
jgi:hypothetical protein